MHKRLVIPAALAVTIIGMAGCSDDEESEDLADCSSVEETTESGHCQPCVTEGGDKECAGSPGCFWDDDMQMCGEAIA